MRKIIIDCDPGHDDAMALFLAVRESELLNILAVGTVGGNHHLDKITRNAQLVLETLNSHVPLYAGCPKPLLQALPVQPDAHGASGMDGLKNTPKITYPVEIGHAVDAYRDLLQKEKDVTFVALGPLTNLALLIQLHPEVLSSIREVSLMGGGIHHGNITPYAEFNIFADPESAKIVFESGIPILMSGLDVTEKAYLTYEDILSLKGKGSVSQFAHELLEFYYRSGQQFGFDVAAMHDACVEPVYFGLNHFGWFKHLYDKNGADMVPVIKQIVKDRGFAPADAEQRDKSWLDTYAMVEDMLNDFPEYLPNTYLQYYLYPEYKASKMDPNHTRANEVMNGREKRVFEECRRVAAEGTVENAHVVHNDAHGDMIVEVAESIAFNKNSLYVVIVENNGLISNIQDDAMVEVTACLGINGPRPFGVGKIDTFYKGMIEQQLAFEKLTVDAYFEGSYNKALKALTLNRIVTDAKKARKILDALIVANEGYWPELK